MNELSLQQQAFQNVDPAAVAAGEAAKARIQSAYIMAYKNPRDEDQARDRILKACRRPAFAERVEFSKPIGKTHIKGPSIRFAELALREWRNVLTDIQVIYEDDFIRRTRIMAIDLETNVSFSKEINITKTVERKNNKDREVLAERINTNGEVVYVVKATEDEIHNKEAALISKAIRNEGLRIIPVDIVDEAIEVAKETLRTKDKADPDAAKKKILDAFSEIGVKPNDLRIYLGHPTDQVSPQELADLRAIYRAIKDGEARWVDYITPAEKEKTEEKIASLKNRLKKEAKLVSSDPHEPEEPPDASPFLAEMAKYLEVLPAPAYNRVLMVAGFKSAEEVDEDHQATILERMESEVQARDGGK
jgi:hypothetical protein